MARGNIFEMSRYKENLGKMTEADFYEYAGKEFEYVEDNNDPRLVEQLRDVFKNAGAYILPDGGISIAKAVKWNYFAKRYIRFQELAKTLDINEFATSNLYNIRSVIEDKWGDCVYTKDAGMQTFDSWLRDAEDGVWYIGNIVFMH